MRNVLLVGVGALGARYLEGFASRGDCHVFVHDIVDRDLSGFGDSTFIANLDCVVSVFFDLVVVATTARGRADLVVNKLRCLSFSKMLLEKPIEQSVENLDLIVSNRNVDTSYVNLTRRCSVLYAKLKKILSAEKVVKIVILGNKFGIACNGLHFIDIVQFITGQLPQSYMISDQQLYWVEAKRPGFFEAHGKMVVHFNSFELEINDDFLNIGVSVVIHTLDGTITVDEASGSIRRNTDYLYDLGLRHIPLVSEYVKSILSVSEECGFDLGGLPSLREVYTAQRLHLDLLSKSWSEFSQVDSELVPAT